MPQRTCLIRCLLLAASLALVPSCAPKARIQPLYPSAADLRVEPKPLLDPAALGSDEALDAHDNAVEAWGERGWRTVARICRQVESWEKGRQLPFDCPAVPGK